MKNSIIIPVFNQWRYTNIFLNSLFDNNDTSQTEIIVINNGSTDETSKKLESFKINNRNICEITNETNIGVANAWNMGVEKATGNYLIIVNNDIVVCENFIKNIEYCFDTYKEVMCISPKHFTTGINLPENFEEKANINNKPCSFIKGYIPGFCFAIRKELIDIIGPFISFSLYSKEDRDFIKRTLNKNQKMILLDNLYIHHFESRTLDTISPSEKTKERKKAETAFNEQWKIQEIK